MNEDRTCADADTGLTQESSPAVLGAMASLTVKAEAQGVTLFFDDPIDIRRALISKRQAAGANTPYGHTCSNIIEQLENLFGYVRPDWADDDRQALPGLMNVQIARLARLTPKQITYQPEGV